MDFCCTAAEKNEEATPMFTLTSDRLDAIWLFNTSLPVYICQSMFVCKQTFVNGLIFLTRHGMTDC